MSLKVNNLNGFGAGGGGASNDPPIFIGQQDSFTTFTDADDDFVGGYARANYDASYTETADDLAIAGICFDSATASPVWDTTPDTILYNNTSSTLGSIFFETYAPTTSGDSALTAGRLDGGAMGYVLLAGCCLTALFRYADGTKLTRIGTTIASAASGMPTIPTLTATGAQLYVAFAGLDDDTVIMTAPSGWTLVDAVTSAEGSADSSAALAYKIGDNDSIPGSETFGGSGSDSWRVYVAAYGRP